MSVETYKELLAWAVIVGGPVLSVLFFFSVFFLWIWLLERNAS